MELFLGTSGYSYKEWKGAFYPPKLAAKDMLTFYASRFSSVEINATFYRMPKAETLEQWAAEVPPSFVFALKAPKRITHDRRLVDVEEPTAHFLETAAVLGERLGPILVQLPPNMKVAPDRLARLLALLPAAQPVAFEFRHPSWSDPEVRRLLEGHGAALCVSDGEGGQEESAAGEGGRALASVVSTARWGYLRLRRCDYTGAELETFVAAIRRQPWERAFVFFKHEDEATGPALAEQMAAIWSRTG